MKLIGKPFFKKKSFKNSNSISNVVEWEQILKALVTRQVIKFLLYDLGTKEEKLGGRKVPQTGGRERRDAEGYHRGEGYRELHFVTQDIQYHIQRLNTVNSLKKIFKCILWYIYNKTPCKNY